VDGTGSRSKQIMGFDIFGVESSVSAIRASVS